MVEEYKEHPDPMDLPRPGSHEAAAFEAAPNHEAATEVSGAKAAETPQTSGSPVPGAANPLMGQYANSGQSSAQPAGMPQISTPHIADDVDLIEKEWVEKAKEIVDNTREDPFKQNQAITQVKADYLRKRYQKDVKLHEE